MRRAIWVGIAVAISAVLAGCTNAPDHTDAWLSYKYTFSCASDDGQTNLSDSCAKTISDWTPAYSYYQGLGIGDPSIYTLGDWLGENGFYSGDQQAHAIYANLADLQFGRDMHCMQSGEKVACYVANYEIGRAHV